MYITNISLKCYKKEGYKNKRLFLVTSEESAISEEGAIDEPAASQLYSAAAQKRL